MRGLYVCGSATLCARECVGPFRQCVVAVCARESLCVTVPYPTCACVSAARTELQWWRVSVGHYQCARVHTSVLESPETVGVFGETEKLTVGRETIELS